MPASYRWEDNAGRAYRDEGQFYVGSKDHCDLVEGPIQEEPETAGLSGYAVLSGNAEIVGQARAVAYKHLRAATILGDESEVVIDLSKVPASAIVRPEPKLEPRRIQGWMNLYDRPLYGQTAVWSSREVADKAAKEVMNNDHAAVRTACVYIDGLEGEGLEGAS